METPRGPATRVGATVGAGCLRLPGTRQGRAAAVARLTVTVD